MRKTDYEREQFQTVQRPRTKRVDIVRQGIPAGEMHHVATCENLETARTLVALLNNPGEET